ncbi:MAG TPA: hypothetical protein VE441_11170, partial [Mycobacterium sp.]|nr:hypothetical protein [Mycobacterium sp.]
MPDDTLPASAVEYLWRAPIGWSNDPVAVMTCAAALAQDLRQLRRFQSVKIWSRYPDPTLHGGAEGALLF